MKRREFLNRLGLAAASLLVHKPYLSTIPGYEELGQRITKNWVWIGTNLKISDDEWGKKFARMRKAGIDAILPEIYNSFNAFYSSNHLPVESEWLEKILPLAKTEGLEVHAWMRCMPCNIPRIHEAHPDWFAINGNGESSLEKPAYVDYYKFLCPSREEVHKFIEKTVLELANYDMLDGIHLDYIRYPDVIIAEALQPIYEVIQDREYPEFDYCYCDVCRTKFKEQTGLDPLKLEDPSKSEEWRKFRLDSITNLVNLVLVPAARQTGKAVTAAVFPNWEAVRQQWMKWNLDAFLPMVYHNFYYGDIDWIKTQTQKGVAALKGLAPLYTGLFVPSLTPDELQQAIQVSLDGGASGISLFSKGAMSQLHWNLLAEVLR